MAEIIKTTNGEATVSIKEEFANEDDAKAGSNPNKTVCDVISFRLHSVTYKLKDLIKCSQ